MFENLRSSVSNFLGMQGGSLEYIVCDHCGYPTESLPGDLCFNCGNRVVEKKAAIEVSDPWGIRNGPRLIHDRFEWFRPLNVGGMGRIDLALDRMTGCLCTVKSPLVMGDSYDEIRLAKHNFESIILRQLSHPHIVPYVGSFTYRGKNFLILKYVAGLPLYMKRKREKLAEQRILRLSAGILGALDYLHKNQIIYRDLKPSNIIVSAHDTATLIDFGAVHYYMHSDVFDTTASIFTPIYAAPEMTLSNKADFRSDIYSFGATLYYSVTCEEPPRPSVNGTLKLPEVYQRTHPMVSQMIRDSCHWDPERRPRSIKALRLTVVDYLKDHYREDGGERNATLKPKICFIQIAGAPTDQVVQLPPGETLIGRTIRPHSLRIPYPYLEVEDSYVSKTPKGGQGMPGHARFFRRHNDFFIEDLSSSNGTFVNGRRISRPTQIFDGDRIMLGPYTIMEFKTA